MKHSQWDRIQEIYDSALSTSDHADASSVDNLVGTTIDEIYRIDRKLERGSIATIYQAVDLRHHDQIVIKVLSQAFRQDPYAVKKFKQEAEALARINHPGVVAALGTGELPDGRPYIAMEYVSGQTLQSQIPSHGALPQKSSLILTRLQPGVT